jgi:predicted RNA-binding protein with PIN domain
MAVILDGYNVIHCAEDLVEAFGGELEAARERLCALAGAAAGSEPVTVVFDGHVAGELHGSRTQRSGVTVLFSGRGETADQRIESLVASLRPRGAVTVVTNDRGVARAVRVEGAQVLDVRAYVEEALRRERPAPRRRRGPKETGLTPAQADAWTDYFGEVADRKATFDEDGARLE